MILNIERYQRYKNRKQKNMTEYFCGQSFEQYRQAKQVVNLQPDKILCQGQNRIRSICISSQCKAKTAVICSQQNCHYCSGNHQQCKMMKITNLLDKIISKKQPATQKFKKSVNKMAAMFDSAIDKISVLKQQFLKEASFFGFSQLQKRMLIELHNQNYQKIKSIDVVNILKDIQKMYRWSADQYNVVKQWKKYEDSFAKTVQTLKNFHIKKVNRMDSKITKDIKTLQYLFHDKTQEFRKIKTFNLLYRASESTFSTKTFHEKCNGVKSIMVLALTKTGKIIGGYNQIGWDQKYGINQDSSNKSFLFSISEKKKYPLLNSKGAIYNSKLSASVGPAFGMNEQYLQQGKNYQQKADFLISNRPQKCYFNIGGCYGIQGQSEDEDARNALIKQFTGNDNCSPQCRVQEWEVFQIL